MYPRLRLYLAVAILSGVFAIHITGCSLIGFGIGSLIDHARTTRYRTTGTRQFFGVSPGTPVVLHLRDSTRVAGRYRGWRDLPDSVYLPRYESWRAGLPADAMPPRLGERVILTDRKRSYHGAFAGFGLYTVRLELTPKQIVEHSFDDLARTRIEGGPTFRLDSAAAAIDTGRLPLRAELTIDSPDSIRHIDASTIASVTLPVGKHAKQIGLAIGVFGDLMIVAVLVSAATYKPDYSGCDSYTAPPGWSPAQFRREPVPSRR